MPAERNCIIAIDSNVLIYARDGADPRRQKLALPPLSLILLTPRGEPRQKAVVVHRGSVYKRTLSNPFTPTCGFHWRPAK